MKFETQEQRDAWEVVKPLVKSGIERGFNFRIVDNLDQAAAEFDRQKATCGIEPLSRDHFLLGGVDAGLQYFRGWRVDGADLIVESKLTDRGREVLANLNAMCEVKK
jgi:hypothetical protein